jgi:predicted glycosyltransferase involved in capsule biosynthesis
MILSLITRSKNIYDEMKLSFLTSSMDRIHHLKQTYLKNIENSLSTNGCKVEFVLLNYNSTDGIDKWVEAELKNLPVEFKYLKTTKPTYFHMSKVKNILGKNATGDVLCWLDADNITNKGFVQYVAETYTNDSKMALKVDWSESTAGTCGRLVCRKEDFLKVGGYDEQMSGWGYEEIDFWKRLEVSGIRPLDIPSGFLGKLEHGDADRFDNYEPGSIKKLPRNHQLHIMQYTSNVDNFQHSLNNIVSKKYVSNVGADWGKL